VVGDVGWETYEEVERISPGQNHGWPCYEGPVHTSGYQDLPDCLVQYANEGTPFAAVLPDWSYLHSSYPNYQAAVVGGPTYAGGPYPDDFDGDIFVGDYVNGFIKRLRPNAQNQLVPTDFATGAYSVDLELGPGNELYYVDFGDGAAGTGSLKRVVYTPSNRTPVPQATATPSFGSAPLGVALSGAGSSDPDGDPLTYEWDFGDGTPHGFQRDVSHTYAAGEFDARLTVRDNKGASATATVHVSAGNSPPTASIDSPADGSTFLIGSTVQLSGSATDPDQGQLGAAALSWHLVLIHNTHVHDGDTLSGANPTFTAASDHDADAHYRITLTATDSAGLTGTDTIDIYPRAVNLALASTPAGAPVTYAGTTQAAPMTRQVAIGFVGSISAADTFQQGGQSYEFGAWSDGGTRAHDITIPGSDVTLTAAYRRVYPFEGESMTRSTTDTSAIRVIAEAAASAGNTLGFRKSPTSGTLQYTTAGDADQIVLRMRGDQCQGAPRAVVTVDGFPSQQADVASTAYTDYAFPLTAGTGGAAGTHALKVEFTNNLNDGTCDRNLYLDKVTAKEALPSGNGYARPHGATPAVFALVPAYVQCVSANRSHGPPLASASCSTPAQASSTLTVGTAGSNGAASNMVGMVRLDVCPSSGCAAPDVRIRASVTDVRCKVAGTACGAANAAGGPDYTGELRMTAALRITDGRNGAALADPATVSDTSFPVTVPCAATAANPAAGSTCAVATTANAVVPGSVTGGARAIWGLGQVEVHDGGADGLVSTSPNSVFAVQGIFVP
jgi:PKD repeat protein